jgi:hypothetical protein
LSKAEICRKTDDVFDFVKVLSAENTHHVDRDSIYEPLLFCFSQEVAHKSLPSFEFRSNAKRLERFFPGPVA